MGVCSRAWPRPTARLAVAVAMLAVTMGAPITGAAAMASPRPSAFAADASGTVWLCRPGASDDPCLADPSYTTVSASGSKSLVKQRPGQGSKFDCFYVYPTVSQEPTTNSDLKVQPAEIDTAFAQASRFSSVCRVWAPMYRQITSAGLVASQTNPLIGIPADEEAYRSIKAGFEDYLDHDNDGRPIIVIGHSQGAAMLILLLSHLVDGDAALRGRLVLAVILGGNVEVRMGTLVGGSFQHIPLCSRRGQATCVIAYSTFPGMPPSGSLFGRPGQGVSLQSGQLASKGLQVACVNPAHIGGSGTLDSFFPSQGKAPTLWVRYDGQYTARCQVGGGASWLQVSKATGSSDPRPAVTEIAGPDWGYHAYDVNLALGDLVNDVASAEKTWAAAQR